MKICYVIGHFYPHIGGAENIFMDYAAGMVQSGAEVRVITSSSGGITGHKNLQGIDIYYYPWPMLFGHPIPKKSELKEHIRWADIVHTTTFTVAPPTRRICSKEHKPVIITIHEVLGDKWAWIEKNKIKASAFRLFEKYVCSQKYDIKCVYSEATENDYKKYLKKDDRLARVYCYIQSNLSELAKQSEISVRDLFGVDKSRRIFLYYGRPGQSKGIFVYLEAIRLLKEKYSSNIFEPITFCFLLSDDPMKEKRKFIRLCKKYSLDQFIRIEKSVKRNDLFKCIQEADYIVVPSITEGFGLSAAEACSLGKMIIASNGGSLPEVVSGKVLMFKNRDSADLSRCLYQVIQKGEGAFHTIPVKNFNKEKMIESLLQVYKSLEKQNTATKNRGIG